MHRRTFIKVLAASTILNIAPSRVWSEQHPVGFAISPSQRISSKRRVGSGFWPLDAMIGKFNRGDLIVIGARPGMGKSRLAKNIVAHVAMGTP